MSIVNWLNASALAHIEYLLDIAWYRFLSWLSFPGSVLFVRCLQVQQINAFYLISTQRYFVKPLPPSSDRRQKKTVVYVLCVSGDGLFMSVISIEQCRSVLLRRGGDSSRSPFQTLATAWTTHEGHFGIVAAVLRAPSITVTNAMRTALLQSHRRPSQIKTFGAKDP